MRSFIAIGLPKEIQASLKLLQDKLKKSGADLKLVKPENIHLTLKFLGEIDENKLTKISPILETLLQNKTAFQIKLSSLGTFPKINSPRVVWVGMALGEQEVKIIAGELEEKLEKIGIPKEDKPFSSHITIARVKSGLNKEKLVQAINDLGKDYTQSLEFTAEKITLFKSTLMPTGPIYEVLKEINLTTI
ncbi:MAG: RNA 2',3'-cyclic phosphodiesterase [Candidatus Omnitrophica bacterium]|nr:RNA 2',3'-cyclic phosphodiesterase [Candidatus Omnitrophota bacterium]